MTRELDVVIERDAEGYMRLPFPRSAGAITPSRSLDTLMERVREAVELCLEVEAEEPERLDFVGVQRIAIAARRWARGQPSRGRTC